MIIKRIFDFFVSFLSIFLFSPIIIFLFLIAYIGTGENGFYLQNRVGKNGDIFRLIKIRTMKSNYCISSTVTTSKDPRVTKIGRFLRKYKLDELPQIYNILIGHMSFVGPRPDVLEIYNSLSENEKRVLFSVRPGVTGPASIKYKNEQNILGEIDDPVKYNNEVIFKDKVRINIDYIKNYNFLDDIKYIYKTLF
jgi:lipopolysaccharide/colanic/teichoic acid biosynthesis glycosyltransferase